MPQVEHQGHDEHQWEQVEAKTRDKPRNQTQDDWTGPDLVDQEVEQGRIRKGEHVPVDVRHHDDERVQREHDEPDHGALRSTGKTTAQRPSQQRQQDRCKAPQNTVSRRAEDQ